MSAAPDAMKVYWAATQFASFMDGGPGVLWWFLGPLLIAGPVTLVHELGHAVVARRLLPGRVFVDVGAGRVRFKFALGGIEFRLAPIAHPLGVAGVCRFDALPTARGMLAIALAGPAATLAGWAVAVLALREVGGGLHGAIWLAALTQAIAFAMCIVPLEITYPGGKKFSTDGRHALDALRHMRASTAAAS